MDLQRWGAVGVAVGRRGRPLRRRERNPRNSTLNCARAGLPQSEMKRLEALDGLRAYAVLLVFMVHAFGLLLAKLHGVNADAVSYRELPPGQAIIALAFRSHYGVDLFFLLSGLLMAHIALRRWPGTRDFYARRALRLYPAYLVGLALATAVAIACFGWAFGARDVVGNLALLQGFSTLRIAAINPSTWSLSFEALFYLVVPVLAALSPRAPAPSRTALLAAAGAFALIVGVFTTFTGGRGFYLAYFALFIPGVVLGLASDETRLRWARRVPSALAIAAWVGFEVAVKTGLVHYRDPLYYLASGLACGLILLKASDDASPIARCLANRPMLWLGRRSYSFFLLHYPLLILLADLLQRAGLGALPVAYGVALVVGGLAICAAASWALFEAVERLYFEPRREKAGAGSTLN